MRHKLAVRVVVMRNGSATPPRSRSHSGNTIRSQLSFARPTPKTWPGGVHAHLFFNVRNWTCTRSFTSVWISTQIGMPAEHIWLDRILNDFHATGGEVRALCDLFIANAARSSTAIGQIVDSLALDGNGNSGPPDGR